MERVRYKTRLTFDNLIMFGGRKKLDKKSRNVKVQHVLVERTVRVFSICHPVFGAKVKEFCAKEEAVGVLNKVKRKIDK